MKFQLYGSIRYAVGSCHDDRSIEIDEAFEIANGLNVEALAIEKAREVIQSLHQKYSHLTDYALTATLRAVIEVWDFRSE